MINFPTNPSVNQQFNISGAVERSWIWNGEAWILKSLPLLDTLNVKTVVESNYTLTRSDSNQTMINMQSSINRKVYVPTDDVDIPIGSVIIVGATGDGYIGLVPANGVTITSPESLVISKKHGKITLVKTNSNYWEVEGNLRPSPTYFITSSHLTREEGNTFKFYVKSDDVFSDRLYYTISPISVTLNDEDFLYPENVVTNGGVVFLSNGNGIFRVTVNKDFDIEGVEDFNVQLRLFSVTGPIVAETNQLSITDAPCEPYQIDIYPWADLFPSESETATFYNNPAEDGVSLNVKLGGHVKSWEGDNVYTNLGFQLVDPTSLVVDGGVYDESIDEIDLWRYSSSFDITDPAQIERYNIVGGNSTGTLNPAPGHNIYPGVASINAWSPNRYVQAKDYGLPISYEMWYSVNPYRTDPLKGYNSYTFFGDSTVDALPIVVTPNGGYVKRYYAGIFKESADLSTLSNSDYIIGVSYEGNDTSGVMKIIKEGVVLSSTATSYPVSYIKCFVDFIYADLIEYLENGKSRVGEIEIGVSDSPWGSISDFINIRFDWPDGTNFSTSGIFDTYLVKWGWYIENNTGLDPGVLSPDSTIWWYPGMFYTMPNPPIPCNPTSQRLPDFFENFIGNGNLEGKLPTNSPPDDLYQWYVSTTYPPEDPDTPRLENGRFFVQYQNWDEIYTFPDRSNYAELELLNIKVIEVKVKLPKLANTSFYNKFGLSVDIGGDTSSFRIAADIHGHSPSEVLYQGATEYTEISLWLAGVEDVFYSNSWIFDQDNPELVIRLELENNEQRLIINNTLYATLNEDITSYVKSIVGLYMYLPSGYPDYGAGDIDERIYVDYVFADSDITYQLPNYYN